MRYFSYFTVCTLMLCMQYQAKSAIIYTDIADKTVNSTTTVEMDLNNDGTSEFIFSSTTNVVGTMFNPQTINFVTWSSNSDWDVFKNLPANTSIGPASGFYAQGDCYFNPGWNTNVFPTGSDQFIGVSFKISNSTYYGWIKVNLASNGDVTIKEYAYENVAGTSILAGKTSGTSSVNELSNTSMVSIYTRPSLGLLQIDSNQELKAVYIYNMAGQVVFKQPIEGHIASLPLQYFSYGIYIASILTEDNKQVITKFMVR